jgi:hypothetical protein
MPQINELNARASSSRFTRSILYISILLLIIFSLPMIGNCSAQVTLAWDVSPSPGVTGYKVHYGTSSRNYQVVVDVGNATTCTLTDFQGGSVYYFAATAYDGSGNESGYSDQVICISISASAGPNGSISPGGIDLVPQGASRTYAITPNPGYQVTDVLVDGISVGAMSSYTFSNITTPHSISATFSTTSVTKYTITASVQGNGSITPAGTVTLSRGASQIYKITPGAGYRILDVLVDGVSVGAVGTHTFTNLSANHTISAKFAPLPTYTISSTAGMNGSITPGGSIQVNHGGSQLFTFEARAGYRIAAVMVDGVSVGVVDSYRFSNVTANHTIFAIFTKANYTLNASAGTNGSISPTGMLMADHGSFRTFSITPAPNYRIESVLVDGQSVGAASSYTFSNIVGDHSIAVTFTAENRELVADAGPDQNVKGKEVVQLSGLNSLVPDNGVSYLWKQISGPWVRLSNASEASPTFTAPTVGPHGQAIIFRLILTDTKGRQATDDCIVNVTSLNVPPLADAGPDRTVNAWDIVTLDGSSSFDRDDGIASHQWRQVSGPAVGLKYITTAKPAFIAPDTGTNGQSLTFQLTVTDVRGLKATDTCIINITSANGPPVARAVSNQSATVGQMVTLDGSRSSEPDDGIDTFHWSQTSGPPVSLSDPTAVFPTFTVPDGQQPGSTLGFLLTVTDRGRLRSADACTVSISGKGHGRYKRGRKIADIWLLRLKFLRGF